MNDKNIQNLTGNIRNTLHFQFSISWQMLEIHLTDLEDKEYLWRPSSKGLHVFNESEVWCADWPESEAYDIGPASIAWLTWHITFWWSMVLDHSFGNKTLARKDVSCTGNIKETKERIIHLRNEWEIALSELSENEFLSSERTRWPFIDKPFHELVAWLNLELMKNAAEIGYCRFLYASQQK
ncbi:DinB family protein [Shimazuella kribbensis]|uniref:DinB family protein n=1 Tax=Shimazuella kribbensis TaxID=139808 RepID=UPI0004274805|nr:DinB family protein [Shimazuella kribbensis]